MKDYWNDLSMKDRNEYIKIAVRNGIITPEKIRAKYNEFAEGGNLNHKKVDLYDEVINLFSGKPNIFINEQKRQKEKINKEIENLKYTISNQQKINNSPFNANTSIQNNIYNNINTEEQYNINELYFSDPYKNTYKVKSGDSLWKIAKENNTSVSNLRDLNPQIKGDVIRPNDEITIGTNNIKKPINIREEWEKENEYNKDNVTAIQKAKHDSNYVIVDKKNKLLQVFNKNNELIYSTDAISTGKSGNDFNTITYVDSKGHIIAGKGNESTPAGITKITGTGTYHGFPSFTRGRVQGEEYEDLASSIHFGNTINKHSSNGCVRMGGEQLKELNKYIKKGTDVYTLPEKEGSKFVLKDGNLSFVADNPYGLDLFKAKDRSKYKTEEAYKKALEKEKISRENYKKNSVNGLPFDEAYKKRFWDDYNVQIDKSYNPLIIKPKTTTDNTEYEQNKKEFIGALTNSKEFLQKKLNLDSDTYNRLAELSLGIAEQESKYGTGVSLDPRHNYKLKAAFPSAVELWASLAGKAGASRGMTQIKMKGDNEKLQQLYKDLGVDKDNIYTARGSALATMARLAYMYNTEVKGRKFTGENNTNITPWEALLYKWNGRNRQLKYHTATPEKNTYINNVKKYAQDFDLFSIREFKNGGFIEEPTILNPLNYNLTK